MCLGFGVDLASVDDSPNTLDVGVEGEVGECIIGLECDAELWHLLLSSFFLCETRL